MSTQPIILRESPLPAMTSFVVANSGPFYVYGNEPIHRIDARDSAPHVWSGLITPVTDYPDVLDKEMSGMHVAGMSPDGKKTINRKYASGQVDLIHRPFTPRVTQVFSLDKQPLVEVSDNFMVKDNLLIEFNHMICPVPLVCPIKDGEWDVPEEARKITIPSDVADFVAEKGVLTYRDKCLAEAEALCGTSTMGLVLRAAIQEIRASIAQYRAAAVIRIERSEYEMEQQSKQQYGKAVYDDYDRRLLWLLGRKEKERQAPQIFVTQPQAQQVTMGADFGEAMGKAIADAVAPLQAELAAMKAKRTRRPSILKNKAKQEPEGEVS